MESHPIPDTVYVLLASITLLYLFQFILIRCDIRSHDSRKPPVLPYNIPLVGHLFQFLLDTRRLFAKAS
jgi:hypothetical protein